MKNFYIYTARYNGELVYIGKGQGERYKHITSGTSHCYEANKAHFLNPDAVTVQIVKYFDTQEEVDKVEERLIRDYKPKWNRQFLGIRRNAQGVIADLPADIRAVKALPYDDRLNKDIVSKVLISNPMSMGEYVQLMGLTLDSKHSYAVLKSYNLPFIDKRAEAKDNRLDTVVAILTDKKNKVAKMPELLKKHGISEKSFTNYKKEFKAELQALGLVK